MLDKCNIQSCVAQDTVLQKNAVTLDLVNCLVSSKQFFAAPFYVGIRMHSST